MRLKGNSQREFGLIPSNLYQQPGNEAEKGIANADLNLYHVIYINRRAMRLKSNSTNPETALTTARHYLQTGALLMALEQLDRLETWLTENPQGLHAERYRRELAALDKMAAQRRAQLLADVLPDLKTKKGQKPKAYAL